MYCLICINLFLLSYTNILIRVEVFFKYNNLLVIILMIINNN